jgi:predicted naringenin-chalcone synthase
LLCCAIHALKLADAICESEKNAAVVIVCTELCTLHFQREATTDNITSSLLFGDGAAAALITKDNGQPGTLEIERFYSEILPRGKRDMAWELSSSGFLMTLSGYIPELIGEDFGPLTERALKSGGNTKEDVGYWCIHPGGRRILDAIRANLQLQNGELEHSYAVLEEFGNMSSATILFVLKKIMEKKNEAGTGKVFAAAFGPGLTMETFLASRA